MNNPNEFYKATVNKQPSGLIRKFFNFKYNEKMIGNIAIDLGCGAFEKIKEFINNNGVVFGGSAGAIIFGYDLEACVCDDFNEIGLEDIKGFDVLDGYSLLCHYTNRNEEKIKSNKDYLLQLSYKRKSIALPEEDTIFINGKNIEIIGDKDYYVFKNGECKKNRNLNIYREIEK